MCGIAGILHFDGSVAEPERLRRMADAMAHRGPDGEGVWTDFGVGLAHRRLAIIDLSGGRQPMVGESGAVLTFNGEIYNYKTLRAELVALGASFNEQSDTEVVLRAYEVWGERCVTHLQGMFAFAVWAPRTRTLFAARDRLGIKPLYYYYAAGRMFLFASELKAIAARGDIPLVVDEGAFVSYLQRQYVEGPDSIFRNVRHLPPGHTLTISASGHLKQDRYWQPSAISETAAPPSRRSDSDAGELRQRLADAVTSHLVADVPVGALLSGGIDSALIVALMAKAGSVRTFSVGFEGGPEFDERDAARRVAAHVGAVHTERLVTAKDAVDAIRALVSRMDEPMADYAALPTFLVSEVAAQHVKVVLTGEGADELFGGYRRYTKARWLAPVAAYLPAYHATHLFSDREVAALVGHDAIVNDERASASPPHRSRPERDTRPRVDSRAGVDSRGLDRTNRLLARDLEGWLPDDLLVKVDRMTMLNSLEARVPYLDHHFVEYALSIPGEQKVGRLPASRKAILRQAAEGLLPRETIDRPKHGFTPPLTAWFNGALGAFARQVLLDPSSPLACRVEPGVVAQLLAERHMTAAHGHRVWSLLVYDLWSREYGVS